MIFFFFYYTVHFFVTLYIHLLSFLITLMCYCIYIDLVFFFEKFISLKTKNTDPANDLAESS